MSGSTLLLKTFLLVVLVLEAALCVRGLFSCDSIGLMNSHGRIVCLNSFGSVAVVFSPQTYGETTLTRNEREPPVRLDWVRDWDFTDAPLDGGFPAFESKFREIRNRVALIGFALDRDAIQFRSGDAWEDGGTYFAIVVPLWFVFVLTAAALVYVLRRSQLSKKRGFEVVARASQRAM